MKIILMKIDHLIKDPKGVLPCIFPLFSMGLANLCVFLGLIHSPGFSFLTSGVSYYAVRLDNFVRLLQRRSFINKIN